MAGPNPTLNRASPSRLRRQRSWQVGSTVHGAKHNPWFQRLPDTRSRPSICALLLLPLSRLEHSGGFTPEPSKAARLTPYHRASKLCICAISPKSYRVWSKVTSHTAYVSIAHAQQMPAGRPKRHKLNSWTGVDLVHISRKSCGIYTIAGREGMVKKEINFCQTPSWNLSL